MYIHFLFVRTTRNSYYMYYVHRHFRMVHPKMNVFSAGPVEQEGVVDKVGGTEAATFCALTTLKKQLDQEAVCDVYQVAKLAHNKRPGIWRSKEDYLYIYQALESLTQVI